MIDKLVARVPLPTKVEYALRVLGLSDAERKSLDGLVAQFGTHPVVSTVLGKEVSDLKQGLTSIVELAASTSDDSEGGRAIAKSMLKSSAARKYAAGQVIKWIEAQPDATNLMEVLQKISNLPLPGFSDTHYPDAATFLSDGALPYLGETIKSAQEPDEYGLPCKCPYCRQSFIQPVTNG
jgi:hypothetical protein